MGIDRTDACRIIRLYFQNLKRPWANMPDYELAVCSYSRWAIRELMGYLRSHPGQSAEEAVHAFMTQMEALSSYREDYPNVFSVAFSTACDIWCELIDTTRHRQGLL